MTPALRNLSPSPRVAIIGAGMCGLACAKRLLKAGLLPTVFDKGRGIGGRMATRRGGAGLNFDHGAQYVTARLPAFSTMLEEAIATERASDWNPDGRRDTVSAAGDWIVGTPDMSALAKFLSDGLDVRVSQEVRAVRRDAHGWRVQTTSNPAGAVFDFVVVTAPAPQARTLLADSPEFQAELDRVVMAPCWALLIAFDERLEVPFDVRRPETGDLGWLARNSSKSGRSAEKDCWVIHASPAWSIAHLELGRESVAATMSGLLARTVGRDLPTPHFVTAHRWRYALTTEPLGRPFLASRDQTLLVGGDWCLGARVEYAFESGLAIADALLSRR